MTPAAPAPDDQPTRTESRDSVLVEFTDPALDFTPGPVSDVVLRHAPSWLREKAAAARPAPNPGDAAALAGCLAEQARLLAGLGRHAEAVPKVAEATQLYRSAGAAAAAADCLHLAAGIHRALGDAARAIECLREEEDVRRRLAA